MTELLRIWTAIAALGAGLVHLALAVGAPPALAVPTALLGTAGIGWGALTFARGGPPAPRVALFVATAPVLGGVALSLAPAPVASAAVSSLSADGGLTFAIAVGLDAAVAVLLALGVRTSRTGRRDAEPAEPCQVRPVRLLLGVGAGTLLVAALTTPALAASAAGAGAMPHGSHPLLELPAAPHHP